MSQKRPAASGDVDKRIKLSAEQKKEEENVVGLAPVVPSCSKDTELDTIKQERDALKGNLEVLEFEYKRALERNERLEEDERNKDGMQARILVLEEQLQNYEAENSNLLNDVCRVADDMVKLTEKCKSLEEAVQKAEAARSLSTATSNPISSPVTISGALPSWPFEVIRDMFKATKVESNEGTILRKLALDHGAIRCVLSCLGTYAHYEKTCPTDSTNTNSTASSSKTAPKKPRVIKPAAKSKQVWAKGTGFASGSTSGKWDVNQMLNKRRVEEENVAILLEVLAYFVNSDDKLRDKPSLILEEMDDLNQDFAPADQLPLPAEFLNLVENSCLIAVLSSYLRNDSVLDIVGRIPLYQSILMLLRVITFHHQMVKLLFPTSPDDRSIVDLLRGMERGIDAYWSTLTKNEVASSSSADKELSDFVCNMSTTSTIVEIMVAKMNPQAPPKIEAPASIEDIYLRIMAELQFGFYDMISESSDRFNVAYHYERISRADEKKNTPARVRHLALETTSLRTTLPLSYSSSIFVRRDTNRLDMMKALIVGPAETPYSNGCFIFDIFFPANYPNGPMLVNLETTGRGSIRFNPNLYNDGKVCLSVLNTWTGSPEERWNAKTSSLLQVLVSIQSLILVPDPYFNEPGYQTSRNTVPGQQESRAYNARIIQATVLWAMLEQLRNPSPVFKEIIQTHFYLKRNEILMEIKKWIAEMANTDTSALKANAKLLINEFRNLQRPEGVEENAVLAFVVPPELEILPN
ncbi:baculoviral IAP repeat-containing protein 6-like [Planococcus citri]|uniref:baculoviral IAP repeat-containing protein 6-like n=1 Tax=Planococcus citri TaxID=170843 RepID=UPI0031F7D70D